MAKSHLKYFNPNPLYKEPKAGKNQKFGELVIVQ